MRLLLLVFPLIIVALSSCSDLRPLYAIKEGEYSSKVYEKLSQIDIKCIRDREGQLLNHKLEDLFRPYAREDDSSAYQLKIKLDIEKNILSLRKDSTMRRQEIHIRAECRLYDNNKEKPIKVFYVDAYVPYSIPSETNYKSLSAIAAEDSSKERALDIIANQITSILSLYFITSDESNNKAQNNQNNKGVVS